MQLAFSSYLSLFMLSICFLVDEHKDWGKSVMLSAYRGFHGSAVKLHSGLPLLPRARAFMTWRATSRFVLPYCRRLSRRCVLTTTARPMHERAERFRFPRVSGNSVCEPFPPSLPLSFTLSFLPPFSHSISIPHSSSVHPIHLSPPLPSSTNPTLGSRRRGIA